MGKLEQFGFNVFKQGLTHFSQVHWILTSQRAVCCFVYSLISAILGFSNVTCRGFDHWKCSKKPQTLMQFCSQNLCMIGINV